jgi:hypothetical protein
MLRKVVLLLTLSLAFLAGAKQAASHDPFPQCPPFCGPGAR